MGKMEFDIFAAEGTYYEIGRQRALTMKESMPDNIRYYVQSTESENGVISARLAHDRMKAIEKACPGLRVKGKLMYMVSRSGWLSDLFWKTAEMWKMLWLIFAKRQSLLTATSWW